MADEPDVDIKFGASTEGIEEGAERSKEAIEGLKEKLDELKEHGEQLHEIFETMLEAAGLEIGLDAIKEWIASSAELGEQLERTAAMLGITGEQASGLMGVSKLTGTSFDGLVHTMERFQVGLDTADSKTSRVGEALRVLGLSAREFIGVPVNQQLALMAEAFSKFADGSGKTAAAMALLGRSGAEMLPYLDRGKEGLEELNATLDATGAKMSNEMVAAFAHTNEDLNTMKLAWQGVSEKIFDVFNPAIDGAVRSITSLLEKVKEDDIRSWASSSAHAVSGFSLEAVEAFANIKAEMRDTIAYTERLGKVISGLASPFEALAGQIRDTATALSAFGAAGSAMLKASAGHAPAPSPAVGPYGGLPQGAFQGDNMSDVIAQNHLLAGKEIADARQKAEEFGATISHMFDKPQLLLGEYAGAAGGAGAGGKKQVPQMQLGGAGGKEDKTAQEQALAGYAEDLEGFKANATAKEQSLAEQLKLHQVTMAQWVEQTKDSLEDERQDVIATFAAEMADVKISTDEKIRLKKEEQKQLDAITKQETAADSKAVEEMTKSWTAMGDQISSILNSQVDALLHGTESIGTAFKNMAEMAIEELAQLAVKIAVDTALMEALSLASGGTLGGFGAGGIIGFIGREAHIPGFAEGTDYVPQTGVALVHQGERVIPASQNNSSYMRGGDTHNYHIYSNASDPREVAREVAKQFNSNPSIRPKY